ncbi:hypothetical protein BW897_29390 [Bacillus cereus]|uniref:Uncharacterized protein n=1 Tax=Bacillus cereus TaxID=1396 RepID=A0A1S9TGF7_BACCE|nr:MULTISPECIES: hypothetical protein [Bacillus]MCP1285216.1 hypothetical protein [Bacillus sp. S0635]OOR09135.1 hypothetical protein BW897_29390 [Bacillus cereus]
MEKESRLTFYDVSCKAHSVKTFDGKTYQLRGAVAIENKTGEIVKIAQVYYKVRSVVDKNNNLIAKRKNPEDELVAIRKPKKIAE